ncbi:MFS transporter [Actinoallomurus acaciae]|uniref:MFS transporter n=1 Tax=Actinoallomurus acaciae TaxID=502577 RepID=A0ABV5YCH2_9ACTN
MAIDTLASAIEPDTIPAPGRLVSRALLLRFGSVIGSSIGFYLPLSVMPMFADQTGSGGGAGLATVTLLLATVACELVTPRLVGRVGYRGALALGLTLLGAPTLLLTVSHGPGLILAVSAVRGAGFAISVVAGGVVTATLIPADRRGEGLALVGIVSGVPGLLALPAGVWAATRFGYGPVFAVTALVPLLALSSVPGLPRRAAPAHRGGVLGGLRDSALVRPATIFATSAAAAGVLVTFLPLATLGQPTWVATAALFVQPASSTVSRWVAGRIGDRRGQRCLLVPGLIMATVGMAALAGTSVPAAVVAGALVFGTGFGVLQNATLTLMYARATAGEEGAVSAIWNAAYDLGMAAGAFCAGLTATTLGYPATFALTAVASLPALALVRRDRDAAHRNRTRAGVPFRRTSS